VHWQIVRTELNFHSFSGNALTMVFAQRPCSLNVCILSATEIFPIFARNVKLENNIWEKELYSFWVINDVINNSVDMTMLVNLKVNEYGMRTGTISLWTYIRLQIGFRD